MFGSTAPIALDIYTPSLPAISQDLHATIAFTQFSVAAFVAGVSFARLLFGILSDAFGRKKPIVVGGVLALIGCISCYYAPNIFVLIMGRFVLGLGAGAINVIGRIVLRDVTEGEKLAQFMSYFSMSGITLMILAPLFGGYLQHFFGWRSIFLVLSIYMMVTLFAILFVFRETNIHMDRKNMRPVIIRENLKSLFSNKLFLLCLGILPLAFGCMLVWETAGPIILQNVVGLSPVQFGWVCALVATSYFAALIINGRFVKKRGIGFVIRIGTYGVSLGGLLMLIPACFHYINGLVIIMPMLIVFFSLGFVIPNSFAKASIPFPHIAGIALAIVGSIQFVGGFLSSSLISILPDNNQIPLATLILLFGLVGIKLAHSLFKKEKIL